MDIPIVLLIVIIFLQIISPAVKGVNYVIKLKKKKKNSIEKQTLSNENADLEIQLMNKNIELANKDIELRQKLQIKDEEVVKKQKEIEEQNKTNIEVLNKVKKVGFLKEYAGKALDYLDFLKEIVKEANTKCIEFGKTDTETATIMSILLQQTLLSTMEIAKWKQICEDIKNNGVVVLNTGIKNCFQSTDEPEQLNAFKKQCVSKLKVYTNAILILCEAYGNLSKFVEYANVSSIETEFGNKIPEIKNKAKEVGIMEIAEVKIFTNIDTNPGTKSGNNDISFPYSNVKNLNNDDIVEVVEFGMKTEFDDNVSETKVQVI